MIVQAIIIWLTTWALYALVAAGFSLNSLVLKFSNFAYWTMIVLSWYFLYMFNKLNIPFILNITLTIIASILCWLIIYFLVRKPMKVRHASNLIMVIVSLALGVLLESIIQICFWTEMKTISFFTINKWYNLFWWTITPLQIIILLVIVLLLAFLRFMVNTKFWKRIRALSDNYELAKIYWLKPEKIYIKTIIVSSIIASIWWILVALERNLYPSMWMGLTIKWFTWAVIGGIYSIPWSVLGAILVGILESLGVLILPATYKDAITFALLFIFLLVKPSWIFTKNSRKD